jgi:hypothetical protein
MRSLNRTTNDAIGTGATLSITAFRCKKVATRCRRWNTSNLTILIRKSLRAYCSNLAGAAKQHEAGNSVVGADGVARQIPSLVAALIFN